MSELEDKKNEKGGTEISKEPTEKKTTSKRKTKSSNSTKKQKPGEVIARRVFKTASGAKKKLDKVFKEEEWELNKESFEQYGWRQLSPEEIKRDYELKR